MILFNEKLLNVLFKEIQDKVNNRITLFDEDDIINYNQALVERICDEFKIDTSFSINDLKDYYTEMYPLPDTRSFSTPSGRIENAVVYYEYNITGNYKLLHLKPKTFTHISVDATLTNKSLKFYIPTNFGNINLSDQYIALVKNERDSVINVINKNLANIIAECNTFNSNLEGFVINLFEKYKAQIIAHRAMKEKLK